MGSPMGSLNEPATPMRTTSAEPPRHPTTRAARASSAPARGANSLKRSDIAKGPLLGSLSRRNHRDMKGLQGQTGRGDWVVTRLADRGSAPTKRVGVQVTY